MRRIVAISSGAALAIAALVFFLQSSESPPPAPVAVEVEAPAPVVNARPAVASAPRAPVAAPPVVLKKTPPAAGETAFEGAWGAKPGQFGRRRDPEANPEAPMAIAAAKGSVLVVDQVNLRVQRFVDGKPVGQFEISDTVQDIAFGKDGKTIALDRLADKTVKVFDANGKLINEASIIGRGIEDPGHVTGVFADDEGIWVERDHTTLVRVADTDGNTDEARPELPGRPTRDNSLVVTAAIFDRLAGQLRVTAFARETLEVRWSKEIVFAMPIIQVLMLDSDQAGNVYVAAHVGREGPEDPFPIIEEAIEVVRIGSDGTVLGSIDLPVTNTGDDMQRPLSVGDDGAIYAMAPSETGLSVRRYAIP